MLTIRDYAKTEPQPLVASVDAPDRISSQQPQYLSKDIRDLQVMQDRVLADNPLEDETELPLGEIVPAEWRVVVLEHTDPNGTRHIIERGMPLDEIEVDFDVAITSQQDGAIEAELDPSETNELNDTLANVSDASVDLTGGSCVVKPGNVRWTFLSDCGSTDMNLRWVAIPRSESVPGDRRRSCCQRSTVRS